MGPVPWMLELSIILELFIGHDTQATIISLLLFFQYVYQFLSGEPLTKCTFILTVCL